MTDSRSKREVLRNSETDIVVPVVRIVIVPVRNSAVRIIVVPRTAPENPGHPVRIFSSVRQKRTFSIISVRK